MNFFKKLFGNRNSRAGIVSQDEFQHRIDNLATDTTSTNNQRWTTFNKGSSIGTVGSEGGMILDDIECIDGARITIEKNGNIAPFSVTLGIYGLMFHTHFTGSYEGAKKFMDFAQLKIDEIFLLYDTEDSDRDNEWYDKHHHLISELSEVKNDG